VGVAINEPRSYDVTLGINFFVAGTVDVTHRNDSAIKHPDIRPNARSTRSVNHVSIADYNVELHQLVMPMSAKLIGREALRRVRKQFLKTQWP